MFKKIITVVATIVLAVTGFTVVPASATVTSNAGAVYKSAWELRNSDPSQGDGTISTRTFTVPTGGTEFDAYILVAIGQDVAKAAAGHTIRIDWNSTFPEGVSWTTAYYGAAGVRKSSFLRGSNGANVAYEGQNHQIDTTDISTFTVPSNVADLTGQEYVTLELNVNDNSNEETAVVPGTYSVAPTLFDVTANQPIAYSATDSTTTTTANNGYWTVSGDGAYAGNIPAKTSLRQDVITCVNKASIAEGNVLSVERLVDGSVTPQGQYDWTSIYRRGTQTHLGGLNAGYTVTSNDVAEASKGLRIPTNVTVDNSGSSSIAAPSIDLIVKNTSASNSQVEATCAANTPAQPTFVLNGRSSATITWAKNADDVNTNPWEFGFRYTYSIYKTTDLTTPVFTSGFDNPQLANGTLTANDSFDRNGNYFQLDTDTNYVIKLRALNTADGVPSLESPASASQIIAAPATPAAPTLELLGASPASFKATWTKISSDVERGGMCGPSACRSIDYTYELYKASAPTTVVARGQLNGATLTGNTYTATISNLQSGPPSWMPVTLEGSVNYILKIKAYDMSLSLESALSAASEPNMLVGPPAPAKPTIDRITVSDVSASFTARANELTGFSYSMKVYDSSAPNDVLATGSCGAPMGSTAYTCMTSSMNALFNAPRTYFVRIFATKNMISSEPSPASTAVMGGIPGVTIGAPSGGTAAGDAKFLTENFTRIFDNFGSRGRMAPDGRGSYYTLSYAPKEDETTSVDYEIRKLKSDFTGPEASFGTSGKLTVSIPNVNFSTNMNGTTYSANNKANLPSASFFAGSSKVALFALVSNCAQVPNMGYFCGNPSTKSFLTEAEVGSTLPAPIDITQKLLDFCTANADSDITNVNGASISAMNGFTGFSRPVASVTCSGYSNGPSFAQYFLATIAEDGTPTLITAVNEISDTENRMDSMSVSANPNATGSEVAAVILLRKNKGANGSYSSPYSNTTRSIIRITADGSVTTTPNAYQVAVGASEPGFTMAALNDGTTVFAVSKTNGVNSLRRLNVASGVFDSGTPITFDVPGAMGSSPSLSFSSNSVPNVDVNDTPDQGEKIAFIRSDWTMTQAIAPMSYRLSDGATVTGESLSISSAGQVLNYSEIAPNGNMYYMFAPSVTGTPAHKVVRWIDTRSMVAVPSPVVSQPRVEVSLNAGGASITINGANLAETSTAKKVTKVKFVGGLNAGIEVTPTSKTATSITVKVPSATQAGITVTPTSLAPASAGIFLVLGGGTTVEAGEVIYVGTTKLAHPLTLNVSEDAATTTDADRVAMIQAGAISQNPDLMMAAPMTPPVLSTTTTSVCSIVDGKVRFLSNGTCTVKAYRAGNAWLADGSVTKNIVVRKTDSVEAGFGPGDLPSEVLERDEAIAPVIKLASGRTDYTMVAADTDICEITDTKMIWFKAGNEDCVITISQPNATAVWTGVTYTWTIPVLPPAGGAGSPLLVRNDNVMVKLPGLGVKWDQKKNQVFFITRVKWVGPVQAKMTFVDDKGTEDELDDVTHTCVSNFGILKKSTLPKNNEPFIISSGAMCTDTKGESGLKLTAAEKTAQTAAYNALKAVVARNTLAPESTNVQFTYRRETHRSSNYEKVGDSLTAKAWSAPMFAKLYYRAIDTISASLPTGITAAVSATADGAFLPTIALESKRTDYTVTSSDSDKCEVLSDGRIWAKVVGENCVLTIGTGTNTVWAGKSFTWTVPMVAAVGASTSSAVVAPSNAVPALAGPLALVWNQAKSTVGLSLASRNIGLVTAKMTFTGLDNAVYTCEVKFGSAKKVAAASIFPFKVQTSPAFCTGTTLTKFKALVTARKSGVGMGVIPIEIAYKFEQHSAATGLLLDGQILNTVVDKPWSATTHFKLNYRATTN